MINILELKIGDTIDIEIPNEGNTKAEIVDIIDIYYGDLNGEYYFILLANNKLIRACSAWYIDNFFDKEEGTLKEGICIENITFQREIRKVVKREKSEEKQKENVREIEEKIEEKIQLTP